MIEEHKFSWWKKWFFPVHRNEYKKVLPLIGMKFIASFVFTVLHATKDTLVVTSKGSGAEVIPILKGGVVLILAFFAMLLYSKLSTLVKRKTLFYSTLIPFLVFFLLFGFVLFPYQGILCPHKTSDWLVTFIGKNHEHWVAVYRYWMNSLFFVISELWGGVVIALLFWGFSNQICSVKEASRFYTLFAAGGNFGIILAGPAIWSFASYFNQGNFLLTIQYSMTLVFLMGSLFLWLFMWTNKNVCDVDLCKEDSDDKRNHPSKKVSLKSSISYVFRSSSLFYIALMVIGYSMAVNMVEVTWKAMLKIQYPSAVDYQGFMGVVSMVIGFVSLFVSLAIGGNIIRSLGWFISAFATPIVLGLCSVLFFSVYFFQFGSGEFSLYLVVLIGAIHNVCCKSMKYCIFDPTKEMAYIPLTNEEKVKGKAAVDMVASRFGKSGSSWIQTLLIEFAGYGSVLNITNFLAPCVFAAIAAWGCAVYQLNDLFRSVKYRSKELQIEEETLNVV